LAIYGEGKNCICKDTNYLTLNNKKNLGTNFYTVEAVKFTTETDIVEKINLFIKILLVFRK
jgi:hypothetical protein